MICAKKPNPDEHEGEESVGCFESGITESVISKIQVKSEPILEVKRVASLTRKHTRGVVTHGVSPDP
jgi:hypothetical protein